MWKVAVGGRVSASHSVCHCSCEETEGLRGELKRSSLQTFLCILFFYGVPLKLTGSLANKFWGSFLPEGRHPF